MSFIVALKSTEGDYKYYSYSVFVTTFLIAIFLLAYEFLYLRIFLNTSITNINFLKYLFKIIIDFRLDLLTFKVTLGVLFVFSCLLAYFLSKNPFKLTVKFSRFATFLDIKKMTPKVLQPDGYSLGVFKRKHLRTNEPLGLLCVAPAGAGKTSGTVIPTILSCDKDCLVINDPKGELYDETAKYRSKISEVYRIEWGQLAENQNDKTCFWNPLAIENLAKGTAERSKYIDMITNILIQQTGGDKFWSTSGRKTLSSVMLYSIYKNELEGRDTSIAACKDILATIGSYGDSDKEEGDPLQEGFKSLAYEVEGLDIPEVIKLRCYTVFLELSTTSPNTLGSVLATVSSDLSVFNNENVRDITSKNSFSIAKIRGEINRPVTIYLISPAAEQELFGVLSGIFVETAYKAITSQDLKIVKQSNIVRFILDEVAFFPKISAVIDGPAIARGYRGSFLFVCQDLGQIREKYTDNGVNTMMTNTAFKIILPQNNDETAKRLASLSGQTQISEWSGVGKGRYKVKKIVNLIESTDVMSMPQGKQIVIVQNQARTPIMCDIPFYFKDKAMLKKLKG